jgi:hypothetical protein
MDQSRRFWVTNYLWRDDSILRPEGAPLAGVERLLELEWRGSPFCRAGLGVAGGRRWRRVRAEVLGRRYVAELLGQLRSSPSWLASRIVSESASPSASPSTSQSPQGRWCRCIRGHRSSSGLGRWRGSSNISRMAA